MCNYIGFFLGDHLRTTVVGRAIDFCAHEILNSRRRCNIRHYILQKLLFIGVYVTNGEQLYVSEAPSSMN